MIVSFDKANTLHFDTATDFLQWYADINHTALAPPLVNPFGARNLIAIRCLTLCDMVLNMTLDDEQFVKQASASGLFRMETIDVLETTGEM